MPKHVVSVACMLVHVIKRGEGTVADGGKDPSLRRPLKLIRFSLGWSQCVLERENKKGSGD